MTAAKQVRELLSQNWKPASQVEEEAAALGVTARQVRTARQRLGVTRETGCVMRRDGRWWWRLPDGQCPTCGGSLRGPWGLRDATGDYWAGRRAALAAIEDDGPADPAELESPSVTLPPTQPVRLDPYAPLVCNVCGKPSAMDRGSQCPWQTSTGVRCPGVMT